MPANFSSISKLNAMVNVFTGADGRLNQGEVDAISGFYAGLRPKSKAKVQARIIDIYQNSEFWSGQKQRFLDQLRGAGISLTKLEGSAGDTADSFMKLSKQAQFSKMSDWVMDDIEAMPEITSSDVPTSVRAKIEVQVKHLEKKAQQDEPDAEVWVAGWQSAHVVDDDYNQGDRVGYLVTIASDFGGATAADMHFFNLNGVHLGKEYVGE